LGPVPSAESHRGAELVEDGVRATTPRSRSSSSQATTASSPPSNPVRVVANG
jgi:hypothetical protein